jgi:hypothetical protein
MRNALPLAALVAALSCSRGRPVEVPPEPVAPLAAPGPVASLAAPEPRATPPESAGAVATPSASAAPAPVETAPVVARTEARETLEQSKKRLAVPCAPLPAKRPADFSVLYEIYTAPRRGHIHSYRRIDPEGVACQDDRGPTLYHDDLALECVHGDGAVMDKLYAELQARGFTAIREGTEELHGPRHRASRVVVRYQGMRCEREDSYGIPIETVSWEKYTGFFDLLRKTIDEIRSRSVAP